MEETLFDLMEKLYIEFKSLDTKVGSLYAKVEKQGVEIRVIKGANAR